MTVYEMEVAIVGIERGQDAKAVTQLHYFLYTISYKKVAVCVSIANIGKCTVPHTVDSVKIKQKFSSVLLSLLPSCSREFSPSCRREFNPPCWKEFNPLSKFIFYLDIFLV